MKLYSEYTDMVHARWFIIGFKRYSTCFLLLLVFVVILVTYSLRKVLKSDALKTATRNIEFQAAKPIHDLLNDAEYRKMIFEKKIEKLSENIARKPRIIPFYNKTVVHPNYNIHIFYYAWYGNLKQDNNYLHWNHDYIPNWKPDEKKNYPKGNHKAPMDIGSNYYPAMGCYSSRDSYIIETHMKQMRNSGIGVLVVSWSPENAKDSPTDILPSLFYHANMYDLKITLHIEPYINRNPINLRKHLSKFFELYGSHPALYRVSTQNGLIPLVYVYDSYLTPVVAWRELLSKKGNLSIRGTKIDAVYIGLLVDIHHRYHIRKSLFDGFYTYFASNGFSYGSSWKNWNNLGKFAKQNNLFFIPSVGPGYIDTQVRPWNSANTRHRRHGQYYDVAWRSAISCNTRFISITSFNEWHEGTQIEPAKAFSTQKFTYLNYEPEGPDFYLNLTKWWIYQFSKKKN